MEVDVPVLPVYGDVCIRKVRRKRQKKLLVLLFLDFARNTTLHGLRYIAESGLHIIEKLFWFLTFVLSTSLCFYFIYDAWAQWQSSPVIVSFSARHVPVEEVPFPAVTICPLVQVNQTKFNYTKIWELAEKNYTEFEKNNPEQSRIANNLIMVCDFKISKVDRSLIGPSICMNDSLNELEEMFNNVINDYSDIFYISVWENYSEYLLFRMVLTKIGLCFTFNGLHHDELLTDEVKNTEVLSSPGHKTKNWTIDGYTSTSLEDVYPYRGSSSDNSPNLYLILEDLDEIKDPGCNSLMPGYKIFLHHPADYPQVSLYSFDVIPGQISSIGIEFTMETANPSLKKYPVEVRQCYFQDDRPLRYYKIYTYKNCMLECLTNITFERCGCVPFYMPFSDNATVCNVHGNECAQREEWALRGHVGECRCLPLCNFINYDADVHKTEYNLFTLLEHLLKGRGGTKSKKPSKVDLYYKLPMFKSVSRSELFGFTDFLANCGGILGLFIGFSCLSLVEIFYFLSFRVFKTIRNDLRKEKEGVQKKDPENIIVHISEAN